MYGREALRRMREQQAQAPQEPERQALLLAQVPPDAPTDDSTVTAWNGERFEAYDHWLLTARLTIEDTPQESEAAIPPDASCVTGNCGGTRIWLVKNGERWLMYVGSRKARRRRRDFATPYLGHAIRTAEQWYGAAQGGWRAEKGRDGKGATEAADLPPQNSTDEEGAGKQADHDLDLDGR